MDYEKVKGSADYLSRRIKEKPSVGIILGSGLGGLADEIEDKTVIRYSDIPHFPTSSLAGHAGNFVFGRIGTTRVAAMQGRFHYYQGLGLDQVTYPVFVMKMLGCRDMIVTNACGGINETFVPGDLMIITDYINLFGENPLKGDNDERFGVRFPDMSEPYSRDLIAKAGTCAEKLGISCKKGVYVFYPGPSYETAAEIRAMKVLGADATGMSTVPETIAANYLCMRVLGISCITNMATGIAKTKHTHEEVVRIANESSEKLCRWVAELVGEWS